MGKEEVKRFFDLFRRPSISIPIATLVILLFFTLIVFLPVDPRAAPIWRNRLANITQDLHFDLLPYWKAPIDWRKWIADYQTYIAGVFAVWAAGITVAAMIVIEIRTTKRHMELYGVSIRRDTLRIERLYWTVCLDPHGFSRVARVLRPIAVRALEARVPSDLVPIQGQILEAWKLVDFAKVMLTNIDQSTKELFPGDTEIKRYQLVDVATEFLGEIHSFTNWVSDIPTSRRTPEY